DGQRIFGDNKTIKGFLGYLFFNIIFSVFFGFIFSVFSLNSYNFFYQNHLNTFSLNLWIGFLLGLFYALFELPNSFLKRRLGIVPGKST
ncbi:MAG: CDP-archaeol synthase, partial [Bacilli bacterium]|nr:CDP-archaeol synthase [Bacilli bacterium]